MVGGARVVIVHDYVTQRGGAERVVLELLRAFPGARLLTSCWNPKASYPEFRNHQIETLWVNRIPPFRHDPRLAFPFLASAFRRRLIEDADVVVCSTSGWAHQVSTPAAKVVYCHSPARWLYQPDDYLARLPRWARLSFRLSTRRLRKLDLAAATGSAEAYVVNSSVVADRVRSHYGIESLVIPPARGLGPDGPQVPVPGLEPGYLLTVSRQRGYKRIPAVCDAVAAMPGERLVVVGAQPEEYGWPPEIRGVTGLSDAQMRWLYANAAGLIAVAQEDFGLTPVEAQAFGLPSVVLRSGGYIDSTIEGVTGVFVEEAEVADLIEGIRALRSRDWDRDKIQFAADRYAPETFGRRMQEVVADAIERHVAAI
jgi:glycosyltransferase involved in cell wall biosynthesis